VRVSSDPPGASCTTTISPDGDLMVRLIVTANESDRTVKSTRQTGITADCQSQNPHDLAWAVSAERTWS
jgi:hypothetical protein